MNNCSNLFLLSTIACQLSECLSEEELNALAADLVVLGDMLVNIYLISSLARPNSPKQAGKVYIVTHYPLYA